MNWFTAMIDRIDTALTIWKAKRRIKRSRNRRRSAHKARWWEARL